VVCRQTSMTPTIREWSPLLHLSAAVSAAGAGRPEAQPLRGNVSDELTSRNPWTRSVVPASTKGDGSDLDVVPSHRGRARSAS
jgi:hypothetical protein